MNTLKTKIITEPKIKRKLDGAEKVCCVGVNRDSQLCYLSAAKQLKYLDVGNFITITSYSARSSKMAFMLTSLISQRFVTSFAAVTVKIGY